MYRLSKKRTIILCKFSIVFSTFIPKLVLMFKPLIVTGIICLLYSCNKPANTIITVSEKDSIAETKKSHIQSVYLTEHAQQELRNLKYFDDFQQQIKQFYTASSEEAKLNAQDLSVIVSKIKDSISIEKINRPDVKARFNVLHNEALRLVDMNTISSIKSEEVHQKIENILYAYESILAKINQIYLMSTNEKNIDVQFQAPKVLIDTVPKEVKALPKKLKEIKNQ